jgi:hypothetical protein
MVENTQNCDICDADKANDCQNKFSLHLKQCRLLLHTSRSSICSSAAGHIVSLRQV